MSLATSSTPADLPPPTWRTWWLAWPKWFRIGCWAGIGMVLLHLALAARIGIGLIESPAITKLKQKQGWVYYWWEPMRNEPFSGYEYLVAGFFGRSCANVRSISIARGTDEELELIGRHFKNLKDLEFAIGEVSPRGVASLTGCKKLERLRWEGANLDDQSIRPLQDLKSLKHLFLIATLVSDDSLPLLQTMNLQSLALDSNDVTDQSAAAWTDSKSATVPEVFSFRTDWLVFAIRWSDRRRSVHFDAPLQLVCDGDPSGASRKTETFDLLCRRWLAHVQIGTSNIQREICWDFLDSFDGHVTCALQIGDYVSQPLTVMENQQLVSHSLEFVMPCTKAEALAAAKKEAHP